MRACACPRACMHKYHLREAIIPGNITPTNYANIVDKSSSHGYIRKAGSHSQEDKMPKLKINFDHNSTSHVKPGGNS